MNGVDDLRSQALQLPVEERAGLIRDLILSLEDGPAHADAESQWADTSSVRADQVASGEFTAADWRESVERMRTRLTARRSS
jgi:hypothetical protein